MKKSVFSRKTEPSNLALFFLFTTNRKSGTGNVRLEQGCLLTLPKVPGVIRLDVHRPVREGGRLKSVTVVQEPDVKWYFSILFG